MHPPMFSIREIQDEDWAFVDRIQREAFTAEALEDIETIKSLGRLSPETCLMAELQEPVGYLIAHPWVAEDLPPLNTHMREIPDGASTFFLHDLALSPKARGQGVAPGLVAEGLARARRLGLRDASLLSIQNSRGFWEKMGFIARPELADKVRPVLEQFLRTDFVFMTRPDLEWAGTREAKSYSRPV